MSIDAERDQGQEEQDWEEEDERDVFGHDIPSSVVLKAMPPF